MHTDPQRLIYVVDDDGPVRNSLASLLKFDAWRVREFDSIASCIAATHSETPACILTDLSMPDGGGIELITALAEQHADIPVIVLTAHWPDSRAVVHAQQAGAYRVLFKPVTDRELFSTLHDATQREALAAR
ncbi:response regulator transcription factor [Solimonas flava]|uniref:response regulator transcription factor n=1 Tax=Solimonas flava TaxID=415849 RepID=UPI000415DDCE|nr:response regulator [Solimonas flava]